MTNEVQLINKTEKMIDEIKSVCANYGLSGASSEYKIITEIFLYKYLNDKFLCEIKRISDDIKENATMKEVEQYLNNISAEEYSLLVMQKNPNVAKIRKDYLISYLFNNQNSTTPEFYELFDNALEGISNDNVGIFSVKTRSKDTIKLFEPLSQYIPESNRKNAFFRAIISKLVEFSFEEAFDEKYDFFSTIFEYLIKDYNKDFGKYAEYYTPNSIARIIAKIMVPDKAQNVTIYDPAAGSGTLILALAHQLRLNLILNNLVHSLGNVIYGDTLLNPSHLNEQKNELKKFDYIVSNPPFKMDFSETRDQLADDKFRDRFFAGVPNIPKKDKDSMAIYLLFIQHILFSLKENGKTAIVVPTGFLTAKAGIEYDIRKHIIDNGWLRGIVSMPSNIFANTNTSVSVMFIDKSVKNNCAMLIDASSLGEKIKDEKGNQRTILPKKCSDKIVDYFNNNIEEDGFSVIVDYNKIESRTYKFSAGQYFNINIEYDELSTEDFNNMLDNDIMKINEIMQENDKLNKQLLSCLKELQNENKN